MLYEQAAHARNANTLILVQTHIRKIPSLTSLSQPVNFYYYKPCIESINFQYTGHQQQMCLLFLYILLWAKHKANSLLSPSI